MRSVRKTFVRRRSIYFFVVHAALVASLCIFPDRNAIADGNQQECRIWHPVELSFEGPPCSEDDDVNPFTDYRLDVEFRQGERSLSVRGFFAADGDAANSGASSGNVWRVRFTLDRTGQWNYTARLRRGTDVAIAPGQGEPIAAFPDQEGTLTVAGPKATTSQPVSFYDRGFLIADGGYFRFAHDQSPWLKGGANSPENLLAYTDFDDTRRLEAEARDGEAAAPEQIHSYRPHLQDWTAGDPTWQETKGKGLIGGINYLASRGVNSMYFLTMNIGGDGKDVWPYANPDDFTRFDCSKLDQWNIVFTHMQSKGIALHVVTQETENERMLDGGDTARMRKLYYAELISRFAHHPALIWDLGEENGPADFSPDGQNDAQRKSMADYFAENDPYGHPIVIHTHATAQGKEDILPPLLGHQSLDGVSFQVHEPMLVAEQIVEWHKRSEASGKRWLISMDEIGKWHTGVVPDSMDSSHDILRRHVLWGSYMSGAAGVEWYFGAKQPHNDLTCEDWRQRDEMWRQTTLARHFFEQHLPFTEMQPAPELTTSGELLCYAKPAAAGPQTVVIYLPQGNEAVELLLKQPTEYSVRWFDPIEGGNLRKGLLVASEESEQAAKATPPTSDRDWVLLIEK